MFIIRLKKAHFYTLLSGVSCVLRSPILHQQKETAWLRMLRHFVPSRWLHLLAPQKVAILCGLATSKFEYRQKIILRMNATIRRISCFTGTARWPDDFFKSTNSLVSAASIVVSPLGGAAAFGKDKYLQQDGGCQNSDECQNQLCAGLGEKLHDLSFSIQKF